MEAAGEGVVPHFSTVFYCVHNTTTTHRKFVTKKEAADRNEGGSNAKSLRYYDRDSPSGSCAYIRIRYWGSIIRFEFWHLLRVLRDFPLGVTTLSTWGELTSCENEWRVVYLVLYTSLLTTCSRYNRHPINPLHNCYVPDLAKKTRSGLGKMVSVTLFQW